MIETVKAASRRVRKGMWIYLDTHPRGWFLITYRLEGLNPEGRVYVAVNGRGPLYALHFDPTADVQIRTTRDPLQAV